jgi:hypothetical protein
MTQYSKRFRLILAGFMALAMTLGLQSAFGEDVAHAVSGVVKSVDKDSKTFVVKASDGTEHTFKWTESTTVEGTKDAGKAVGAATEDAAKGTKDAGVETYLGAKKGSKVTVKYAEKAGEKTALGIKDASKATAKTMSQ